MSVSVVNNLRVWNAEIYNVDADPSVGGLQAGVNSLAIDPLSNIYYKSGAVATNWTKISSSVDVSKYVAYVNKNGDDATGLVDSAARPFLTIQAAINACVAAGYNTGATRCNVIVSPGTYTENLTLVKNVNLTTVTGEVDYTTRIIGSHSFTPTTGVISDNTINIIGFYLQNTVESTPTITFAGTAASRIRVINSVVEMSNAGSVSPTILLNNANASLYFTSLITAGNISRLGAAADAIQITNGTFNSYGCDIEVTTGNAINIAAGIANFAYGTITGTGNQSINVSGGSLTLTTCQIVNSTLNKDGVRNAGGTVVAGIVAFNIAGTTGYCARGTGTFLYNNLTFIGALGNSRIQNTLTAVAIPSTPTFVA